jgi:chromate transporter
VTNERDTRRNLKELAFLFLKLGVTAFGGPAAHIAMMEDEVVRRRQWITRDKFLDLLAAANLIPGPSSTELAIYIGYLRGGWAGLLLGGTCFILPAALIVTGLAWAYVRFGAIPEITGILYGVKPVVVAVILQALWNLGRSAVKSIFLGAVGMAAVAAILLGVNQLLVLLIAGAIIALTQFAARVRHDGPRCLLSLFPSASILPILQGGTAGAATVALWPLFLFFLKIGSVVFGSGYVLLAFLREDLVERYHWLTNSQLLDAVAIGQVTPGPVFTTATFIGYILAGPKGAAVGTIGIFLPSFLLVAISGPLIPQLRRSALAGAFLDGVTVAALALMAVVTFQLGRSALTDPTTIALALISALLLFRFKINSAWLVLGGGAIGYLVFSLWRT